MKKVTQICLFLMVSVFFLVTNSLAQNKCIQKKALQTLELSKKGHDNKNARSLYKAAKNLFKIYETYGYESEDGYLDIFWVLQQATKYSKSKKLSGKIKKLSEKANDRWGFDSLGSSDKSRMKELIVNGNLSYLIDCEGYNKIFVREATEINVLTPGFVTEGKAYIRNLDKENTIELKIKSVNNETVSVIYFLD